MHFFQVYILESLNHPETFYTGYTQNLEARLRAHNAGQSKHTAKYKPWKIRTAFFFDNKQRAKDFELYLKSGSGRAFSKKRL